jgi:hypothetical protein
MMTRHDKISFHACDASTVAIARPVPFTCIHHVLLGLATLTLNCLLLLLLLLLILTSCRARACATVLLSLLPRYILVECPLAIPTHTRAQCSTPSNGAGAGVSDLPLPAAAVAAAAHLLQGQRMHYGAVEPLGVVSV